MNLYSNSRFAEKIGVTTHTLRVWHKEEKLIPTNFTDSGTRYYPKEQFG